MARNYYFDLSKQKNPSNAYLMLQGISAWIARTGYSFAEAKKQALAFRKSNPTLLVRR